MFEKWRLIVNWKIIVFLLISLMILPSSMTLFIGDAVATESSLVDYTENDYLILESPLGNPVTISAEIGEYAFRHEHHLYNERGARNIFVPSEEGDLYIVNTGNVTLRASVDLENGCITTRPLAVNLNPYEYEKPSESNEEIWIFAGTETGKIFCIREEWINPGTGDKPIFQYNIEKILELDGSPVLPQIYFDDWGTWTDYSDDLLYAGTENGSFYAFNMNRNNRSSLFETEWVVHVDGEFRDGPSILNLGEFKEGVKKNMVAVDLAGEAFVFSVFDEEYVKIDTGNTIKSKPAICGETNSFIIIQDTNEGGRISRYNLSTGIMENSANTNGNPLYLIIDQYEEKLFLISSTSIGKNDYGIVSNFNQNLSLISQYETMGIPVEAPFYFLRDCNLYFGTDEGYYYSVRSYDNGSMGTFLYLNFTGKVATGPIVIEPESPLRERFLSQAVFLAVDSTENGIHETRIYAISIAGVLLEEPPNPEEIYSSGEEGENFMDPFCGKILFAPTTFFLIFAYSSITRISRKGKRKE